MGSAPPILKGLRPKAQGCETRVTLGEGEAPVNNPEGVAAVARAERQRDRNALGVVNLFTTSSQGSSALAPENRRGAWVTHFVIWPRARA